MEWLNPQRNKKAFKSKAKSPLSSRSWLGVVPAWWSPSEQLWTYRGGGQAKARAGPCMVHGQTDTTEDISLP